MIDVLLIDSLILNIYLANVSRNRASNRKKNVSKINFQDQVVYQENIYHHFLSTGATEKPESQVIRSLNVNILKGQDKLHVKTCRWFSDAQCKLNDQCEQD